MSRIPLALGLLATSLAISACVKSPSAPTDPNAIRPAVLSIVPASATTGVDPAKPVTITFNYPMMTGMEMLVVLHEGTVTGPQVAGTSSWSGDRTVLTFTPSTALKAKTNYILHFSPSLKGANGQTIDLAACTTIGGQYVSGGMMGSTAGGMMNGQWGPGMMGTGWQASDGTFGMFFTFTTT
jgi:hypothetical protein